MKQLSFESREDWGKVNQPGCPTHWFNTYGGHIIETTWNPEMKAYQTVKHQFNYPDLSLMPNE
jgi:hypothetical protein